MGWGVTKRGVFSTFSIFRSQIFSPLLEKWTNNEKVEEKDMFFVVKLRKSGTKIGGKLSLAFRISIPPPQGFGACGNTINTSSDSPVLYVICERSVVSSIEWNACQPPRTQ